jgi:hypothetical protein
MLTLSPRRSEIIQATRTLFHVSVSKISARMPLLAALARLSPVFIPTHCKVLCVHNLDLNITIMDVISRPLPGEVIKILLCEYSEIPPLEVSLVDQWI